MSNLTQDQVFLLKESVLFKLTKIFDKVCFIKGAKVEVEVLVVGTSFSAYSAPQYNSQSDLVK